MPQTIEGAAHGTQGMIGPKLDSETVHNGIYVSEFR